MLVLILKIQLFLNPFSKKIIFDDEMPFVESIARMRQMIFPPKVKNCTCETHSGPIEYPILERSQNRERFIVYF
jgi:hypothetical protein